MKEIVKKFLKGVPVSLIAGVVNDYLLGTLKNPSSKEYQAAKTELVSLAKAVQDKWPDEFAAAE
ncbi:MAG TPA: hypothetical protein VF521_11710 [Pyrinomonadaceae bacterium]